jgi:RHS repeat-associated protein
MKMNLLMRLKISSDNNGSLLSKFHNANDKVAYTWNLDRQLAGVQTTDSSGTHQSTYTYDADGNRVRQTVDGVSTNYLVDTNRGLAQVAAEYDSSGVKASYTYAGGVISQSTNNLRTFYVNDGHSGVRLITNSTGAVTDAYNYDGYGNLLQSVGNANNERYRGESSDSATGLQYLRARYYDPSTGRFLSTDAFEGVLESPVSRHRYLYGNNNPLTYADPSGNFSIAEVSTVLSILETLTIATVSQASIGQIARQIEGDIIWKGKFYKAELNSYFLTQLLGVAASAGGSILELETLTREKSPWQFPGITDYFKGRWIQFYAGVSSGLIKTSGPLDKGGSTKDVSAISPRIFGATSATFTGTFAYGEIGVGYDTAGEFTVGFGRGFTFSSTTNPFEYSNDSSKISLKEGISLPLWLDRVNNQPTLPPTN